MRKLRRRTRHHSHKPEITIHRVRFTPIDDQVRGRLEHALGISLSAQQFMLENAIFGFLANVCDREARQRTEDSRKYVRNVATAAKQFVALLRDRSEHSKISLSIQQELVNYISCRTDGPKGRLTLNSVLDRLSLIGQLCDRASFQDKRTVVRKVVRPGRKSEVVRPGPKADDRFKAFLGDLMAVATAGGARISLPPNSNRDARLPTPFLDFIRTAITIVIEKGEEALAETTAPARHDALRSLRHYGDLSDRALMDALRPLRA